jgi:secreted trypsin-like serine protease
MNNSDSPSASPFIQLSNNPSSSPTDPVKIDTNSIGGDIVLPGAFNFYAWVNTGSERCGGSLIYPDVIMSAASCGCALFENNPIFIGGTLADGSDAMETVDGVICEVHPAFDESTQFNDIMLIKILGRSSITPVTLTFNDQADIFEASKFLGFDVGTNRLAEIQPTIVSDGACSDINPNYRAEFNICANDNMGSVCPGDGGGPLIVVDSNDNVGYVQVGVVSTAIIDEDCASPGLPAVYTQVSSYNDFIVFFICGSYNLVIDFFLFW